MSDFTIYGGQHAALFGNQQVTVRNSVINQDANDAINMVWDCGWTFHSISINNCSVGFNITNTSPTTQTVGSRTVINSSIMDTVVGVLTSYRPNASYTNGSLVLENFELKNVAMAIQGISNSTSLRGTPKGSSRTIAAWAQGHSYKPTGPSTISGPILAFQRSQSLLDVKTNKYYTLSKVQCTGLPVSQLLSARAAGAEGNGKTDDTDSLQMLILQAAGEGKVLFLDYALKKSHARFTSRPKPRYPVVQVGKPGDKGWIELSDFIVGIQGAQAGAVGIEWNIKSRDTPSGMWDVHVRIGGFAGSDLQLADCRATPGEENAVNEKSIGAHTLMHVKKSAEALYMENVVVDRRS
ncbi:MAG: hypothetical protein Q9184_005155 [Pyrenodesmia sp. 2 TL-2023]